MHSRFGIVPVEAQACGKAVIAFAKGGALETVKGSDFSNTECISGDDASGVFFSEQTPKCLNDAVVYFEKYKKSFSSEAIRKNVMQFDKAIFKEKIKRYIESKIK